MSNQYTTTSNILNFDANAKYLTATPDSPDFTNQIQFVSDEIDMMLRNYYTQLSSSDLEDSTQLEIICIHGVLSNLYRSAVLSKGSSAQMQAEHHRKVFESLLRTKIDLINGQSVKLGAGKAIRA